VAYKTISVSVDGAIGEIRLNRPENGNRLDNELLAELLRAAEWLAEQDAVHAVTLTAEGISFSAGWDVSEQPPDSGSAAALRALEMLPQPVIACIDGEATSAGLELALACDIRIAGTGATFSLAHLAAGDVPSLGATQRLPRLIGQARATAMILLGEELDAEAALACGLISELTPPGDAAKRGREIALAIAGQGPIAVRYAKEAIRQGLDMPLEQALRYETDLTVILQTTGDRAEGVRAFLEKRPPKFDGR
jgi:enoyl-CoA hydratase/carnithine racemase